MAKKKKTITVKDDSINIGIATYKNDSRLMGLELSVNSLINQCDNMFIYLNNYDYIPSFLVHEKIHVFLSKEHRGDLADQGKFYGIEFVNDNCYYLTCDDDFIYPKDYVSNLINNLKKYKNKVVCSHHGRIYLKNQIDSYYKSECRKFITIKEVKKDIQVHLVGTGVMAFHTSNIKVSLKNFKDKYMSDVWMSKYLNDNKIPAIVCKHEAQWLKVVKNCYEKGILQENINKDEVQTRVMNELLKTFTFDNIEDLSNKKIYGKEYEFICMPTENRGLYKWSGVIERMLNEGQLKDI